MRKKQAFALLAALFLAVSATACGSSANTGNAETEKTAEAQENPADTASVTADPPSEGGAVSDSAKTADNSTEAVDNSAQASAASTQHSSETDSGFVPEDSQLSEDESVIRFPAAGISFTLPESFKNTKGFLTNGGGEIVEGDGVYCMYYNYVALSEDDFNNLLVAYKSAQADPEKYETFFNPRVLGMFSVYAADKSRTAEEIGEYLKKLHENDGTLLSGESPMEGAELIGTAGEYNFYFLDETQPDTEIREDDIDFGDEYDLSGFNEEYAALVNDVKNNCPGLMTFFEPEKTGAFAEPDSLVSFDSFDLDGHPVSSEDLFSQNKVTMINIWASFCGPCINEMPELESLYTEFKEKGCGIIGVLGDAAGKDDTAVIDEGKKIVSDTGVTYPNVIAWDGMQGQLPFNAFPTTYFVDSGGKVIGSPIVGADVSSYTSGLRDILKEIGK